MTALSKARDVKRREGHFISMKMNPVKIYKGSIVLADASDGFAQSNDGATTTLANGDIAMGIARDTVDNSAGSAGDLRIDVLIEGVFELPFSDTITQANVGDKVYVNNVSDDGIFTITSDSGNPQVEVGTIVEFLTASTALVALAPFGVAANGS